MSVYKEIEIDSVKIVIEEAFGGFAAKGPDGHIIFDNTEMGLIEKYLKAYKPVEKTPEPETTQPPAPPQPRGAPIENNTHSSSFDLFKGTSLEGKKQGF